MKLPNAVAIAALLGCLIAILLLVRARNELALANAALASAQSANADLIALNNDLKGKVVDGALLKRLESDQREAIRLRREVSALKQSLAAAERKVTAAAAGTRNMPAQVATPDELTTNAYSRIHSRKVNANIPIGHGLLLGGWPGESGKQTFAMAVPEVDPSNPGMVVVQTKIFEVSDEALGKLDATTMTSAAGNQATLDAVQLAAFQNALKSTPGVDLVSSPRIQLFSGQQGRAYVGNQRPTPEGMKEFGSSIDLIPTVAGDGKSIDLTIDAKLTLPNTPAQQ